MDASDPRYSVVQELMAYWLERPHASDTVEGIRKWWLNGPPASAELVEGALKWLIDRGVVVTHTAADGRVHYRLADGPGAGPC